MHRFTGSFEYENIHPNTMINHFETARHLGELFGMELVYHRFEFRLISIMRIFPKSPIISNGKSADDYSSNTV